MSVKNNLLRKGLDFTGVGVCYFCHDGTGRVAMMRRSKRARDEHGRWDIGAGAIEFGDGPEQTLLKEIKEEFCADALRWEFLGYRSVVRAHGRGQSSHWLMLDYKVLVNPDQVAVGEPEKFDGLKWFTKKSFPKSRLHSQLPYFLKKYQDSLF